VTKRCGWAQPGPMQTYHDEEWGHPVHDERLLFEFLILEGAQAGLSWSTVLNKREAYRRAFANFEPAAVARFDAERQRALLLDAGIIRNRLKIESAIRNACAYLDIQEQFGSFDAYLWSLVGGQPLQNRWKSMREVPATSAQSDALSKDLRKRGFTFVGSTIMYAFMQAVGLVNDHIVECYRWRELGGQVR